MFGWFAVAGLVVVARGADPGTAVSLPSDPAPSAVPPATPSAATPTGVPEPPPALTPPTITSSVEAPYPAGVDLGTVDVDLVLLVNEQGQVETATVVAGQEPFATLAAAAAKGFVFSPAMEGGVPVAVELPFRYEFPEPPVNLSVRVLLEGASGDPGPLEVTVDGLSYTTDAQGLLELKNVAAGPHTVHFATPVYVAADVSLEVHPGERADAELHANLVMAPQELVAVYRRERDASIRRTLTAEEVRSTPGTMGDPIRAVQNLPGLARTPLDAGWLLVRGGDPEDTGLYIDGVRVPLIYHLGGFTSVLHPALVDQVDFLPGGTDVRYGRAIGGAVNLKTRTLGEGTRFQGGADLVSSGVLAEVPAFGGTGGFEASVRRSYLDAVLAGIPGISDQQAKAAPRFWDWSARADTKSVGLFAFGYSDAIDVPNEDGSSQVTVGIGTARVHGRWDFELGGRRFRLTPLVAREWRTIDTETVHDLRLLMLGGGRLESEDDGAGDFGYGVGLDVEGGWFGTSSGGYESEGRFLSPDPYGAVRWGRRTAAVLGMRLDTLAIEGQAWRTAPSPRLELRHTVSDSFLLRANAGWAHQWPPLDVAIALPGGPYLPLEESRGAGFGGRYQKGPFQQEVDVYGRQMSSLAIFEEDGSLGQGQGVAYGVESLTRDAVGRFSGWTSLTLSHSLRREEEGDAWVKHLYDQPVVLVVVVACDLGKRWMLAGRFRDATGYPLDPDSSVAYDVLTQRQVPLVANANGRLPDFRSVDLKVSRRFEPRGWVVDAYLDVQNVTNTRVPEPAITGFTETSTVYTYGLPVLPIFGVQGVFGSARDPDAKK